MIIRRGGGALDVVIRVSRIFLTEENGQIVSFRPLIRSHFVDSLIFSRLPEGKRLVTELAESENAPHLVRMLNQLPAAVRDELVVEKREPQAIRKLICDAYEASLKRLIALALDEHGEPPVPFLFPSLGSSGRRELTLFSDQDNALIFADPADEKDFEKQRRWFLQLAAADSTRVGSPSVPEE